MHNIVEQLPEDEAYNFIRYAIQHHPEVAASLDKYRHERELIPNQNPTVEGLPWCRCGECRAMPTGLLQEGQGTRAVHYLGPPMPHCVSDTHVVSTAVSSEACDNARISQEVNHRTCRHIAYRQYVLHKYGHCGAGNWKVVPSCVTWAIRGKWPSTTGEYRGCMER